jgi:hypothetical protein
MEKFNDANKYAEEFHLLHQEFISRFQETCKCEVEINLISVPFDINIKTLSAKFHVQITHFLCDTDLRNTFRYV